MLADCGGGERWRVHLNKSHKVDDGTATWRVSTATKLVDASLLPIGKEAAPPRG